MDVARRLVLMLAFYCCSCAGYGLPEYPVYENDPSTGPGLSDVGYYNLDDLQGFDMPTKWSTFTSALRKAIEDSMELKVERFKDVVDRVKEVKQSLHDMKKDFQQSIVEHVQDFKKKKHAKLNLQAQADFQEPLVAYG